MVLREILFQVVAWQSPPPSPPEFQFKWSSSATWHNPHVLRKYHMDLNAAIRAQPFSTITPGSEFCPVAVLQPLCGGHPLWPRVRQYLTHGTECPLQPIAETDRLQDLRLMLQRGNHKSAIRALHRVIELLQDEVKHMWQLPFPPSAVMQLPGIVIAPVGLAEQQSINERGELIPKQRLTHDQSFNVVPGTCRSVNDRICFDALTPCRYGHALLRFIHVIIALRSRHPHEHILLTKVDLKAAYRRLHYSAAMAVQACVLVSNLLLVALRLTFGGAANPSQWSDVSELVFDLANDLVRNSGWDPVLHTSPHQHLIADRIELQPPSVPFVPARAVTVSYPDDSSPKCDGYLDDAFMAFLEHDRV
jgi:hypothetical protein